ncbi:MAG: molybdate ABC transporter substrate-binding protein [Planctomycetota bacterium]|nr:MAG: molybdate ABC transporter substrate-binding protein [Planctomycetota bacterium]
MKRIAPSGNWWSCGLLLATAAFACGAEHDRSQTLVFAAASLTDVVSKLAEDAPGGPWSCSFGPTSGLARQIQDGAPADFFLSANRHWMETLDQAGCLQEPPRVVARNRLVCIAPAQSPLASNLPEDLSQLLQRLAPGDRIALADEGVPAGEYSRESFRNSGHWSAIREYAVGLDDVRSVLRAVAQGEAAAGFVYFTDARVADVITLFALDPKTHRPIEYLVARLRPENTGEVSGRDTDYWFSPKARQVFQAAGFAPPLAEGQ